MSDRIGEYADMMGEALGLMPTRKEFLKKHPDAVTLESILETHIITHHQKEGDAYIIIAVPRIEGPSLKYHQASCQEGTLFYGKAEL